MEEQQSQSVILEEKQTTQEDALSKKPLLPSGRTLWHGSILVLFLISALCGIYLTVKPGMRCEAQKTDEKSSVSSALADLSTKDKPSVAWIKVRGVIATDNSSSPFSRPQGAGAIAKKVRDPRRNGGCCTKHLQRNFKSQEKRQKSSGVVSRCGGQWWFLHCYGS